MNEQINKWRLPTIQELKSIVDYTKYNPATNLEGIKSDFYWTSSLDVSDSNNAWIVGFYIGDDYRDDKSTPNQVRCVRTLEDGTLEWAKEDAPAKMNWQEAMDYAESLNSEPKKTIVLETWLVESTNCGYYIIESTREHIDYFYSKVKLLSTRGIEI